MKPRMLNGYVVVYQPHHPKAMTNKCWKGFIYEHILVATKFLGREIREDEEVHHLNLDRSDNRPENLLVLPKSQHTKLHAWLNAGAPGYESPSENRVNSVKPKVILRRCEVCSLVLSTYQARFCSEHCYSLSRRKVERPSLEQLEQDLDQMSYLAVGRKYGVSDNAIRKWLRQYRAKPEKDNKSIQEGVETRE